MNKESVNLAYLVNPTQTCKQHHLHNTDNMTDINQVTQVAKSVSELWKTGRYLLWKDNNILT